MATVSKVYSTSSAFLTSSTFHTRFSPAPSPHLKRPQQRHACPPRPGTFVPRRRLTTHMTESSPPPSPTSAPSTASSSSAQTTATPNEQTSSSSSTSKFSWTDQWYPVAWEYNVTDTAPFPFRIFDHSYVLFRDAATGLYSACDDACPHRLAPLSEGRVFHSETLGHSVLECSYHGWRFSCSSGTCLDIPNAPKEETKIPTRANIPRMYAVSVSNIGLIFVFLGNRLHADQKPLPISPRVRQVTDKKKLTLLLPFTRTFPFPHDTLIENLIDPSHVSWAHHGNMGSDRRKVDRSDTLTLPREDMDFDLGSFRALRASKTPGRPHSHVAFLAPGFVYMCPNPTELAPNAPDFHFMLWSVPISRNKCSLFLVSVFINAPFFQRLALNIMPTWLSHMRLNIFLDGDSPLLQLQHAEISSRTAKLNHAHQQRVHDFHNTHANGNNNGSGNGKDNGNGNANESEITIPEPTPVWRSQFVPSPGGWDSLILAFRRWFDMHSTNMPYPLPPSPTGSPPLSRREINDHEKHHVLTCAYCKPVLRNARAVRIPAIVALATFVAAAVTLTICQTVASIPVLPHAIACAFIAIFSALVLVIASRIIKNMTYTEIARELVLKDDTPM